MRQYLHFFSRLQEALSGAGNSLETRLASSAQHKPLRILFAVLGLVTVCIFGGSAILAQTTQQSTQAASDATALPAPLPDPLLISMSTSAGNIVLELNPQLAPASVQNFINYVQSGFYTQTIFHRVIEGFMIQGGGFTTDFQRKNTNAPVQNEANNGLQNNRYTIAMARTSAPHSATAQFFINAADNDFLNYREATTRGWGYTVFGKVIEGEEVVDAISRVETGAGGPFGRDVPRQQIVINSIDVLHPETEAPEQPAQGAAQAGGQSDKSDAEQTKSE